MRLHRLEEPLRRVFEEEQRELRMRNLKLGSALVLALMLFACVLDYLIYPSLFALFFTARMLCNLLVVLILVSLYTNWARRWVNPLSILVTLLPAFCISWMIFWTEGAASPFYAGLIVTIIGGMLLMPFSAIESLLFCVAVFASYLLACAFSIYEKADLPIILSHMVILTMICVLCVAGSYCDMRRRVKDFLLRRELEVRNRQLLELDQLKSQLVANVSHEFRTPLMLMLGPLEQLLGYPQSLGNAEARSQLELARRNGLRLLKLVNALLDFCRIEAGQMQAMREGVDLASLTADLASNFRSAIEAAGMRLTVDCPPLPERVAVDREMWEKIVLNLVSNAFKFTLEGEIIVRLRVFGEEVELSVQDTGVGIPAEEMSRLFQRFHRVRCVQGRTHEGTGIGLALVQELVRLHGGTVRVESVRGKGSAFTVSIPRIAAESAPPAIEGGGASGAKHAGAFVEESMRWLPTSGESPSGPDDGKEVSRQRILLADDNADMRQYIGRILSDRYDLVTAGDGEEALAEIRRRPPMLVISDVMMPKLDGISLLKTLRADEATRAIPVILLSANAADETCFDAMTAGAEDYLIKPFSAKRLVGRIDNCLALARLRREHSQREAACYRRAEEESRRVREELEVRVLQRTLELTGMVERLNKEVQERTFAEQRLQQEEQTLRQLLDSGDHERQMIVSEIHDGLAQPLTAASMYFQTAKSLLSCDLETALKTFDAGVVMLNKSLHSARRMMGQLRPLILDEQGVGAAIEHLVNEYEGTVEQTIEFQCEMEFERLDPIVENAAYRIVQDALDNACKHSRSPRVRIELRQVDDEVMRLEIRDWGIGFDPQAAKENSFGLKGIRERARLLGRRATIESAPGQGTRVVAELPLRMPRDTVARPEERFEASDGRSEEDQEPVDIGDGSV